MNILAVMLSIMQAPLCVRDTYIDMIPPVALQCEAKSFVSWKLVQLEWLSLLMMIEE